MVTGSSAAPETDLPWPRRIAVSMEALAKPARFASVMASARRLLVFGSGPCNLEACEISFDRIVR